MCVFSRSHGRRRDELAASGEDAGRVAWAQESDAHRFNRYNTSDRPAADRPPRSPGTYRRGPGSPKDPVQKNMNKSRLTRYMERHGKMVSWLCVLLLTSVLGRLEG